MSTVEVGTEVVGMTVAQATEKYGAPAEGKKFAVRGGFVVFDETGSPVVIARKKRSKGGGKKKGSDYTIEDGGLRSHETPNFVVGKHRKLKQDAFKGCDDAELSYTKWNVWYHQQLLERAQADLKAIEGTNPETRKEAKENAKLLEKATQLASVNPEQAKALLEALLKANPGLMG